MRFKLSEQMPNEEAVALYHRVRSGDPEAKKEMVMGHAICALGIAKRVALLYPNKKSDLQGQALLELVEAVDRISTGAIDHHDQDSFYPAAYIVGAIFLRLKEWAKTDNLLGVSPKTYVSMQKRGERVRSVVISAEQTGRSAKAKLNGDDQGYLDLWEVVNLCVEKPIEKEIVLLRLAGYVDEEIGIKLGFAGRKRIWQIKQELGVRILEKLNARGSGNGTATANEI